MTEKRLNVRVPSDLLREIQIECIKAGVSVSDLVRDLLTTWLKTRQQEVE